MKSLNSLAVSAGVLIDRVYRGLKSWSLRVGPSNQFEVFLQPETVRINKARLDHLASLELNLAGKKVLEVGAGVGLLTSFFEERECDVLSTDGRDANVAQMREHFPLRRIEKLDLDREVDVSSLGEFDIVFCYGTLYHLSHPERALQTLSDVCTELILLETCLTPGNHEDVHLVREGTALNQAIGQIGCRPTRPWIMKQLTRYWGHAYISRNQPQHEEFETDWVIPGKGINHRAVFVGSKEPLISESLLSHPPDRQIRLGEELPSIP